jgi:DNA-binding transcriptional LysR family regulator
MSRGLVLLIRRLEDLVTVAEVRNLMKAAELRNIARCGLGRRIRSLQHRAATVGA